VRRGGREGKDRAPSVVAAKGVPFACEREMGGTGEGVNEEVCDLGERGRAEEDVVRPGIEDTRMWDAPELEGKVRLVPLPPPPLTAAVWGRLLGLNPEGESLTADPCGGRDGSEGMAGLG
jgi:hypothetical protein